MNKLLIFSAGVAIGAVSTYTYFKNKFKKIADEEIASVKEAFYHKNNSEGNENIDISTDRKKAPFSKRHTTVSYHDIYRNNDEFLDKPYIITPEEFSEFTNYRAISLTYYADKILADENDEPVEDLEETIGEDALNHFGEYEDDSVFIRNDAKECDYEIILDTRKFSDVVKKKPHGKEDKC